MPTVEEFLKLPTEEQEEIIKRLLHETIHEGVPGVKETAYGMGLTPSRLYKCNAIDLRIGTGYNQT